MSHIDQAKLDLENYYHEIIRKNFPLNSDVSYSFCSTIHFFLNTTRMHDEELIRYSPELIIRVKTSIDKDELFQSICKRKAEIPKPLLLDSSFFMLPNEIELNLLSEILTRRGDYYYISFSHILHLFTKSFPDLYSKSIKRQIQRQLSAYYMKILPNIKISIKDLYNDLQENVIDDGIGDFTEKRNRYIVQKLFGTENLPEIFADKMRHSVIGSPAIPKRMTDLLLRALSTFFGFPLQKENNKFSSHNDGHFESLISIMDSQKTPDTVTFYFRIDKPDLYNFLVKQMQNNPKKIFSKHGAVYIN